MKSISVKKSLVTISIVSALAGSAMLGNYLDPLQLSEVEITETEIKIPEDYYIILTKGIANKYDLSQSDLKGDLITDKEFYTIIDAYDKKLQESRLFLFPKINTTDYTKHPIYYLNNYLRQ